MIDSNRWICIKDDEIVNLTHTEFVILMFLIEGKDKVLTREYCKTNIFYHDGEEMTNQLDVYINYLRNKLGKDLIRTVRKVGYILD